MVHRRGLARANAVSASLSDEASSQFSIPSDLIAKPDSSDEAVVLLHLAARGLAKSDLFDEAVRPLRLRFRELAKPKN